MQDLPRAMEPTGAPPPSKPRTTILLALLAIALLLVGFGAGYYLGQPAPQAPPGPVDGLARPSTIPRIAGWYQGASVDYADYGLSSRIAIPILVFFQQSSPNTPAAGQRNIIDSIPGQPGYSDFWRVHKVLVPSSYVPNTIRSFEDAFASGYVIEATDLIVNCPVVNPGTTIQGSPLALVQGWYRGREVFYFDHGMNAPAEQSVVTDAPIWAFFHGNGTAVPGQRNVIDAVPGEAGYSDLWRVTKVTVADNYIPNSLTDAADILAEAAAGNVTLETTDLYVNCPVL